MSGRTQRRPGYRKGGAAAGGGSRVGGGGKRGRPPSGWEKGDIARDIAAIHDPTAIPRKPGRPVPHEAEGEIEPEPPRKTIWEILRAENHKVLVTLRKLEDTAVGRPDERERLRDELGEHLTAKRRLEDEVVFPLLLDHPEVREAMLGARDEWLEIDERFAALRETSPVDRHFKLEVEVLHGLVEHQIQAEESVLSIAESLTPIEQAVDLAARFAG